MPDRYQAPEVHPWTGAQVAAFFEHVREAGDRLGPLYEVIVGCGLRRGEALGLRWSDVDLEGRVLRVRGTLSVVNGRLSEGAPKTKASDASVGLSARVVEALVRQREQQDRDREKWASGYADEDRVFAREDGSPLRPEYVLRRFHVLADEAGLPHCKLHGLRHAAASLMLGGGVPLAIVSKTLRHSQVSITADIYGHLSPEVAQAAADALDSVLDAAAAENVALRRLAEQKRTAG